MLSMEHRPQLNGISIDTSRAKSNLHVVSLCAQKLHMIEYKEPRKDGSSCNIYWHNVAYSDMRNSVKGGAETHVNRFPGMSELSRKISLTQAVHSMKQLFPHEYQFYPNSWVLPTQLNEFCEHCALNAKSLYSDPYYIVKPDDGAQGTGIYLIRSPKDLRSTTDRQLIQEYIADPYLLIDQLKFDFRVYVVIKSINPLSIYIAREGMARFCTEKYAKPTPTNFENLYSHLTNYSLNKANGSYVHSKSLKDQIKGSKRLLSTVFHQMESRGVETRKLWYEIKMIVVKTVLAMVPEIMLNYEHYFAEAIGPQCFQILGFDIIVRSNGLPLLLEVNAAPSLSIEHTNIPHVISSSTADWRVSPPLVRSIVDEMIKVPLVHDCLLLVSNKLQKTYPLNESASFVSTTSRYAKNSVNDVLTEMTNDKMTNRLKKKLNEVEDDLGVLKKKQKPHLSEIFPGRYGEKSRHLLVLDRAVYLFMQFVNVKQTLLISYPALKAFLRKCNLIDVLTKSDLQKFYSHINNYFTRFQSSESNTGLPFHGFLQVLFHISRIKFEFCDDNLAAFLRLLAFCNSTLRYYGVRSARLRRTELELFDAENANTLEIYLLPERIRLNQSQHNQKIQTINNVFLRSKTQRSRSVPSSKIKT